MQKTNPTRHFSQLVGQANQLARLQEHALRLVRLQRILDRSLPQQFYGSVQVANLDHGTLVLHTDTPSLASRIKMMQDSLLRDFVTLGENVHSLRIKVRVTYDSARDSLYAKESRQISDSARSALENLEHKVDQDSPLGQALKHLLKNSR